MVVPIEEHVPVEHVKLEIYRHKVVSKPIDIPQKSYPIYLVDSIQWFYDLNISVDSYYEESDYDVPFSDFKHSFNASSVDRYKFSRSV